MKKAKGAEGKGSQGSQANEQGHEEGAVISRARRKRGRRPWGKGNSRS